MLAPWSRAGGLNIGILVPRSDGATVRARVKRNLQSHFYVVLAPWEIKTFFYRGKAKNRVFMRELGMEKNIKKTSHRARTVEHGS